MSDLGIQEKVIETLVAMNTAITNLRLYPPTNAMILKTIDRLYEAFQIIFEESDSVIFSESDRILLIAGEPLSQKHQGKPQVSMFLMLMFTWGIKSLTFMKGLDKSELMFFLEIMGKKPDDVKKEGGLEQFIAEGKTPHILFNQKIYIAKDQDQQILASLEIKDEDIVKYITSEDPNIALDSEKIKDMAKDPEWIGRIFQSGMHSIVEKDSHASSEKISEGMVHMLQSLEKITAKSDKKRISQLISGYIADMDPDLIAATLTQNIDSLLENRLLSDIINRIDRNKFEIVAGKIISTLDDITLKDKGNNKISSYQQTYKLIMNSDKGIELQERITKNKLREEEERKNKIAHLKSTGSNILNNLDNDIHDGSISKTSPAIVRNLFSEGENDTAETIIDRLSSKLLTENDTLRVEISSALADILDDPALEQRDNILNRILEKLKNWVKFETIYTAAYRSICTKIKNLVQSQIKNHRLADALPIIETFHSICSKQCVKNEEIQSVASEMLRDIASEKELDFLIEEFRTNTENQRNEAGRILVLTSEFSIYRLLDLLNRSEDASERILLLNLIPEMGPSVVQTVVEMIDQNAPWYYTRNLARLLGRIGSEEQIKVLRQLMLHEDHRVQREALKSINAIGGSLRGKILLDALQNCDDRIKSSVVASLGSLKYRDAVKQLIELFKLKLPMPEDMKIDLQEKICIALGNIGDREAMPFLAEVGKQSGFLSFKSYHQTVKSAAVKAIGNILSKN
ncbi:MAG: HEAT repeat domain-containing protein [Syntrophaceae bacterium]